MQPAHAQTPFTQSSAPEHSALVPQRHAPAGPQLFDVVGSHDLHVLPCTPHDGNMFPMQVPLVQHPMGHDDASQMQLPDAQRMPAEHAAEVPQRQVPVAPSHESAVVEEQVWQACPPMPHALGEAGLQVWPLKQHPFGHEAASQTQLPPTQLLPAAQAGLAPH
jgi:hypothetical protein